MERDRHWWHHLRPPDSIMPGRLGSMSQSVPFVAYRSSLLKLSFCYLKTKRIHATAVTVVKSFWEMLQTISFACRFTIFTKRTERSRKPVVKPCLSLLTHCFPNLVDGRTFFYETLMNIYSTEYILACDALLGHGGKSCQKTYGDGCIWPE